MVCGLVEVVLNSHVLLGGLTLGGGPQRNVTEVTVGRRGCTVTAVTDVTLTASPGCKLDSLHWTRICYVSALVTVRRR